MEKSLKDNVASIGNSFEILASKLKNINSSSIESVLNEKDIAQEIIGDINKILKQRLHRKYLPLQDLEHRLRGKIDVYYGGLEQIIREYKEENLSKESIINEITNILMAKQNLVDVLQLYKNLNTEVTGITTQEKILQLITKHVKKEGVTLTIKNNSKDNSQLQCSERISESVIYELLVNYGKYGTDGTLNITTQNDQFTLTLTNNIKEKHSVYSTNNGLKILHKYIEQIGGNIEHKPVNEKYVTTITIPTQMEESIIIS